MMVTWVMRESAVEMVLGDISSCANQCGVE